MTELSFVAVGLDDLLGNAKLTSLTIKGCVRVCVCPSHHFIISNLNI